MVPLLPLPLVQVQPLARAMRCLLWQLGLEIEGKAQWLVLLQWQVLVLSP